MGRQLEGVRVIDLGQIYAAPYCTLQLAAMGAEVIKIEPPGTGEILRRLDPEPEKANYAFLMLNANKKSVTLNLKDPRGRELLFRMLEAADVLVENYSGGMMESLHLGYEDLRERFPRLVYASAKGYGSDSRFARLGAMDSSIQAACGYISVTGFPDEHGVKTPATFIDMGTGSHLATGILAALLERARTGRGQRVEVAMFDIAVPGMTSPLSAALQGRPVERLGNRHPGVCPSNVYPACDGELLIFCLTEKHWRELAALMGRVDALQADKFRDHAARLKIADEVDALVGEWTRTEKRDELIGKLIEQGIPAAPVRTIDEIISDAELIQRGLFALSWYPARGAIKVLGLPIKFSGDNAIDKRIAPPPTLGADTDNVLSGLGIDAVEVDRLRTDGVI